MPYIGRERSPPDYLWNKNYWKMKILVIDDERPIRSLMKEILDDEGHVTDVAEDGEVGLQMAEKERYDVIFCDIKMPNLSGEEVLGRLKDKGIDSPVVMISGHGDIDTAVKCIKLGAFDFLSKPLDLNRILITIKNATDKSNLMKEAKLLKKKVYGQEMIGESPEIQKVKEMIDKVAPTVTAPERNWWRGLCTRRACVRQCPT